MESKEEFNMTLSVSDSEEIEVSEALLFARKMLDILTSYYIPLLIIVGIVGNLLSCVVFLGTHLRVRSSSHYLAALAIADFTFLVSLLTVYLDLYNRHGLCQIVIYLSSVSSFLSVYLIVSFTVERFIAVQYPLHRPQMCTVRRAKLIIVGLVIFALLTHSYLFWMAGLIPIGHSAQSEQVGSNSTTAPSNTSMDTAEIDVQPTRYICEMIPDYYQHMHIINIVDTCVTYLLPLFLIIIMNTMIARQLFQFSRKYQQVALKTPNKDMSFELASGRHYSIRTQSGSSQSGRNNNNNCTHKQHKPLTTGHPPDILQFAVSCKASPRNILSLRTQYNITKMLLLISTVFVVLNFPSYVIRIHVLQLEDVDPASNPGLGIVQQFTMILYYTNFSINFLLYSTYGVTFRCALCKLTLKFWPRRSSSYNN